VTQLKAAAFFRPGDDRVFLKPNVFNTGSILETVTNRSKVHLGLQWRQQIRQPWGNQEEPLSPSAKHREMGWSRWPPVSHISTPSNK